MRHELNDYEWCLIKPMLPSRPRGAIPDCTATMALAYA
jgi:transposase